jgi:hypothetical protein
MLLLRTTLGMEPHGDHLVVEPPLPAGIGKIQLQGLGGPPGFRAGFRRMACGSRAVVAAISTHRLRQAPPLTFICQPRGCRLRRVGPRHRIVVLLLLHGAIEMQRFSQPLKRFGRVRQALKNDVRHAELGIAAHRLRELLGRTCQGIVEDLRLLCLEFGKPAP